MYLVRPFPGRVNAAGEKEFGGVYCWFASPNEKFTRDYGGGKISFQSQDRSRVAGKLGFFKDAGSPLVERAISRELRRVA